MEQPQKQRTGRRGQGPGQLFAWIFSSALLVAALGLLAYRLLQPKPVPAYDPPPPPVRAPEPRKDLAPSFAEAKELISYMKWTEAREKLLEIQSADPAYPGLKDALDRVEKELANSKHFDKYSDALGKRKLALALSELNQVSADSVMFGAFLSYRNDLREHIEKQLLAARAQLAQKNFTEAQAVLEDVLAAAPDQEEARELLDQAIRQIPLRTASPPTEAATGLFLEGKLPAAMALAAKCAPKEPTCKDLSDNLKLFQRLFKESSKEPTTENLETLISAEERITGPKNPSQVFEKASPAMKKALTEIAKTGREAKQWARAVTFAMHVRGPAFENVQAVVVFMGLRQQGISLYHESIELEKNTPGHCKANLEDCTARLREIMELTNPKQPEYQLAKLWLGLLSSPPHPVGPGTAVGKVDDLYAAAMTAKSKRQWARTLELAQSILAIDPKHAGANRIIEELHQRAVNLAPEMFGDTFKDTNPEDSIPRYQEIMDLTLPDDELHQKAKNWLDKLAR